MIFAVAHPLVLLVFTTCAVFALFEPQRLIVAVGVDLSAMERSSVDVAARRVGGDETSGRQSGFQRLRRCAVEALSWGIDAVPLP
jgi:hypothetical protein